MNLICPCQIFICLLWHLVIVTPKDTNIELRYQTFLQFPLIGYLNIVSGVPSTGHGQIGSCNLLYLFFFKSSF